MDHHQPMIKLKPPLPIRQCPSKDTLSLYRSTNRHEFIFVRHFEAYIMLGMNSSLRPTVQCTVHNMYRGKKTQSLKLLLPIQTHYIMFGKLKAVLLAVLFS